MPFEEQKKDNNAQGVTKFPIFPTNPNNPPKSKFNNLTWSLSGFYRLFQMGLELM